MVTLTTLKLCVMQMFIGQALLMIHDLLPNTMFPLELT